MSLHMLSFRTKMPTHDKLYTHSATHQLTQVRQSSFVASTHGVQQRRKAAEFLNASGFQFYNSAIE